jgi:hypothetical protein
VKAVGDFDYSRETITVAQNFVSSDAPDSETMKEFEKITSQSKNNHGDEKVTTFDISEYKPDVQGRVWTISERDLEWITIGCYILGTGGGGSPYGHMLRLREIMRNGGVVHVISPDDLCDDDLVACGGGKGSPTVSIEKLNGDEYDPHCSNYTAQY